ncbi:hypothetical protein H2198_006453 [Neophaeococcomyces mojaviensis]|uniref:Uncharacterized protein n=1 Tax=Neophaeococcomyces mojaviensis TaxID=3383035 RepID=A0ACC3A380_9EURO|nr:hypothetical protein H2198_006453 [Knufia sp. JES_112]
MGIVTEVLDALPIDESVLEIRRDEALLLTRPQLKNIKLLDHGPIAAVHFPTEYIPQKFSPPRGIYESDHLRLEWQQMNFRQPFYHRNADVDELSYQVCGDRTLMTEYGSVELCPGDFSRIPVGVAHDNYGREEIHLLFYIPAPVSEVVPPVKTAEMLVPPFETWTPQSVAEVMTECLGGPECDIAVSMADEELLLRHAQSVDRNKYIRVLKATGRDGELEWLYKSKHVWIGTTEVQTCSGDVYRRHRRADEIQCQIKGKRTLVTQRGIVELEPGDFVSIPNGVAFTDIVHGSSTHISVLTHYSALPKAPIVKEAALADWKTVQGLKKLG